MRLIVDITENAFKITLPRKYDKKAEEQPSPYSNLAQKEAAIMDIVKRERQKCKPLTHAEGCVGQGVKHHSFNKNQLSAQAAIL